MFELTVASVCAFELPGLFAHRNTHGFDETSSRGSLLLLKLSKLLLTVVGHCLAQQAHEGLAQALKHVPSMGPEGTLHSVGMRLATLLHNHNQALHLPDLDTIQAVLKLAWDSAGLPAAEEGSASNQSCVVLAADPSTCIAPHQASENEKVADEELCQEALETLTLALSLQPSALSQLLGNPDWSRFVLDLLLHCPHRCIRQCAADQLCLIATKCTASQHCLLSLVELLFAQLPRLEDLAGSSQELFGLLCRLLGAACRCPLPALQQLLADEIGWLKRIREKVQQTGGLLDAEESLLEGHLGVARELVLLLSPADKHRIGSDSSNTVHGNLVKNCSRNPLNRCLLAPVSRALSLKVPWTAALEANGVVLARSTRTVACNVADDATSSANNLARGPLRSTPCWWSVRLVCRQIGPELWATGPGGMMVALLRGGGATRIQELLEDFAFPASRVEAQLRGGAGDGGGTAAVAVCPGPDALRAALDLLVALCTQCPENLGTCAALLSDMFYADQPPLQEWEYLPPVGPRPRGGFVGLKNAGATCYMNSVLQQV
ncbi:hypothetical protein HPB51_019044 [Rhipicephalus microplus]|uniref:USP domain-containing protein n=1 Tax=Rhipicephalus microplus TaxID=6941 RepID=A0A9J6D6Q5_RHIMP|nr:hypothetical protein HPB51_019044 [Rhipicephalus microplus]